MTTKQYLNQIRMLDVKINHRIKQAEEIRKKAFMLSGIDTEKDRVQTSHTGNTSLFFIDKYVDMMLKVDALIDKYVDLKNTIISQIDSLEDERYCEILYYRYVEYMTFPKIAEKMTYTVDHVWRLHRYALQEFEKNVPVNVD